MNAFYTGRSAVGEPAVIAGRSCWRRRAVWQLPILVWRMRWRERYREIDAPPERMTHRVRGRIGNLSSFVETDGTELRLRRQASEQRNAHLRQLRTGERDDGKEAVGLTFFAWLCRLSVTFPHRRIASGFGSVMPEADPFLLSARGQKMCML